VSPKSLAPPSDSPVPDGALTLFEIPFATAMSDSAFALLARTLDLSTRVDPTMWARHESSGVLRLDHYSGLFLHRGSAEGQWMLEARTWGHPAAQTVHEWHVLAAGAAHQLDATVTLPERWSDRLPEIVDRPVGRAANRRLAHIRRRLVGLP
jgi:hypothetical protein